MARGEHFEFGGFKELTGSSVILYRSGVYKQAVLALRQTALAGPSEIYAKWAGGYVRLLASGWTSLDSVAWDYVALPDGWRYLKTNTGPVRAEPI